MICVDEFLLYDCSAASTSVMLPVALAIADECANCTKIRQENEQDLMIIDQQNTNNNNLSKPEADNIKKSLPLNDQNLTHNPYRKSFIRFNSICIIQYNLWRFDYCCWLCYYYFS